VAYLLRWLVGALAMSLVFVAVDVAVLGGSAGEFFNSLLNGRIAGLESWLEVFQPLAATFGLVAVALAAGLAVGLPLGLVWGKGLPWTAPIGVVVVLLRSAFPIALALLALHYAVAQQGWTVPGFLAISPEGGIGISGRFLIALFCLGPLAAGEVAWSVAETIYLAGNTGSRQFPKAMGVRGGAIFDRWILPQALADLLAKLPVTLALLVSWAAVAEWIFRIGGLGRSIIAQTVGGDLQGALLGVLVLAVVLSAAHGFVGAFQRSHRWLGVVQQDLTKKPVFALRPGTSWRLRVSLAAILVCIVPLLPLALSAFLPVADWTASAKRAAVLLGDSSDSGALGHGRALLRMAVQTGATGILGTFLSGSLGIIWGVAAAMVWMPLRSCSHWIIQIFRSLPLALVGLLATVARGGFDIWVFVLIAVLVGARIAREVAAVMTNFLTSDELLVGRGLGQKRWISLWRALEWPLLIRIPSWLLKPLRWWIFIPAFVSFVVPGESISGLGAAVAEGMPMIWEEPWLALAPGLLLALLAVGFGIPRLIVPHHHAVDAEASLR